MFFNGQLTAGNEYYSDILLLVCGSYLMGAASNREYRMGIVRSRFISRKQGPTKVG